ncbi:phosphotransferase [Alisedimentitalea sp. MJ-SS2]|uniref:phosphotransferase n=1 Tax=Aliisedimentitalea sp. MJ-SS2 TaxID=3049795 RepID=UPI0029139CA2|nr:phosphotransferase [Alisedimentitalea sp. MJ-SS2]MDU8928957.1 phosphotransferase [Alisedimentitalea sp. MJ-SS2]
MEPGAVWSPLDGGRTNLIWRVDTAGRSLVCKLYKEGRDTPLFVNDAKAEALALQTLTGTGIAPEPVATSDGEAGQSLIYYFVEGVPWRGDIAKAGRLLKRLHDEPAPQKLPRGPMGPLKLLSQAKGMLDEIGSLGDRLRELEPQAPDVTAGACAFLHGDPVPGNLVEGKDGLTLIDWQCPAIGDPCDDLAVFLSPAMQYAYGNAPLSRSQEEAFLLAYGDRTTIDRYRKMAPVYHWRMAIYCLWQHAQGEPDYKTGAELEIRRLKRG